MRAHCTSWARIGENGFLFEIDDYEVMSQGIGELLADPELVKTMSARSLEIVSKHDLSVTLDKFEELYAEVIAMRSPVKPELSEVL